MFYWLLKRIILGPILQASSAPGSAVRRTCPRTAARSSPATTSPSPTRSSCRSWSQRRVTFLAKADYFTGRGIKGRLTAAFFKGVGQLPVDRSGGKASEAALQTGLRCCAAATLLGIYPEGTRSPGRPALPRQDRRRPDGAGGQGPGAARRDDRHRQGAAHRQVIPQIGRVGIVIGKPLDFSRYDGMEDDRFVLRSITDEIMYELMELSGQEYVDIYASTMKERSSPRPAARRASAGGRRSRRPRPPEPRRRRRSRRAPPALTRRGRRRRGEPRTGADSGGRRAVPAAGDPRQPRSGRGDAQLSCEASGAPSTSSGASRWPTPPSLFARHAELDHTGWPAGRVLAVLAAWTGVSRGPCGRRHPPGALASTWSSRCAAVLATRRGRRPGADRRGRRHPAVDVGRGAGARLRGLARLAGRAVAAAVRRRRRPRRGRRLSASTVDNIVLLFLARRGASGYAVELFAPGAATSPGRSPSRPRPRERERLAARHPRLVLQVLAYVHRRGQRARAARPPRSAALAGEQEARLRCAASSAGGRDRPRGAERRSPPRR